jgi:hypothetical protein
VENSFADQIDSLEIEIGEQNTEGVQALVIASFIRTYQI